MKIRRGNEEEYEESFMYLYTGMLLMCCYKVQGDFLKEMQET